LTATVLLQRVRAMYARPDEAQQRKVAHLVCAKKRRFAAPPKARHLSRDLTFF